MLQSRQRCILYALSAGGLSLEATTPYHMLSAAASLLLAVLGLAGGALGLMIYALLLLADLQSDYLNPYSFVDGLNPKLSLEAWLHVPMAVGLALSGYGCGLVPVAASGAFRCWCLRHGDLRLDPTTVFREAVQNKLSRRWAIGAFVHMCVVVYAVASLAMRGPLDSWKALHASNAQFTASLRKEVESGNASWSTLLAHTLTQPGLFQAII